MATLFLHLGAPLTGCTKIQKILSDSESSLLEAGIELGIEKEIPTDFRLVTEDWVNHQCSDTEHGSGKVSGLPSTSMPSIAISSRKAWSTLQKAQLSRIPMTRTNGHGFDRIKILLFVRNPIDRVVSMWMQRVKFNGNTDELKEFMERKSDVHAFFERTLSLMEWITEQKELELSVYNFSHSKQDLASVAAEWLELPGESVHYKGLPPFTDRLDLGEARLQLELNRILGPGAILLSKALASRNRDLSLHPPIPPINAQESIWKDVEPLVARMNTFIPFGHRLAFDRMEPADHSEEYNFNEEQLRIAAECLGGEVRKIWNRETAFSKAFRGLRMKGWTGRRQ